MLVKCEISKCNLQSSLEIILLWRPVLLSHDENKRQEPVFHLVHWSMCPRKMRQNWAFWEWGKASERRHLLGISFAQEPPTSGIQEVPWSAFFLFSTDLWTTSEALSLVTCEERAGLWIHSKWWFMLINSQPPLPSNNSPRKHLADLENVYQIPRE